MNQQPRMIQVEGVPFTGKSTTSPNEDGTVHGYRRT